MRITTKKSISKPFPLFVRILSKTNTIFFELMFTSLFKGLREWYKNSICCTSSLKFSKLKTKTHIRNYERRLKVRLVKTSSYLKCMKACNGKKYNQKLTRKEMSLKLTTIITIAFEELYFDINSFCL